MAVNSYPQQSNKLLPTKTILIYKKINLMRFMNNLYLIQLQSIQIYHVHLKIIFISLLISDITSTIKDSPSSQ